MKINIIPIRSNHSGLKEELNWEAICIFSAIGFFLDQNTYYKDQKVLKPGYQYRPDEIRGNVLSEKPWFQWHYSPRELSLKQAVAEFADLFETIIHEQTGGRRIILPLSGGLDIRTQAAALKAIGKNVYTYSYSLEGAR